MAIYKQLGFSEKLAKIEKEGIGKLHVVSDFDKTLTKAFDNGKKVQSGFALLRKEGFLDEKYVRAAHKLFDHYHPIEIDNCISLDKKMIEMKNWWQEHLDLMISSGLTKKLIEETIRRNRPLFRDKSLEMLEFLNRNRVPLLIFSSGLGDLITGFLEKEKILYDNTCIIANFYKFSEGGKITGYKDEIIHVFNKNEQRLEEKEYSKLIHERKNVILLGDSLGDLRMTAGIKHDIILRIGFLNENIEGNLAKYKEEFDVVITDDGSMEPVLDILRSIKG